MIFKILLLKAGFRDNLISKLVDTMNMQSQMIRKSYLLHCKCFRKSDPENADIGKIDSSVHYEHRRTYICKNMRAENLGA